MLRRVLCQPGWDIRAKPKAQWHLLMSTVGGYSAFTLSRRKVVLIPGRSPAGLEECVGLAQCASRETSPPHKRAPVWIHPGGVTAESNQVKPAAIFECSKSLRKHKLGSSLPHVCMLPSLFDVPLLTVHGKAASSCHECAKQPQQSFFFPCCPSEP